MNEPYGTVRRAPHPSFAHAIKIEQPNDREWEVIDLYGSTGDLLSDKDVKDWLVVYKPQSDKAWVSR